MYRERKVSVIGIAAGKGGVGKSTLTVQLARALYSQGLSVGILDADLYGPSIRKMLPEDKLPLEKNGRLIPAYASGLRTLSLAYFKKEEKGALMRAPIANKWIKQFLHYTDWEGIDLLLIDFPPGTGDIQLTLAQEAHLAGAIMVTTPQQVSVIDVKKAAYLFHEVNVPLLGVVENMSYYLSPQGEKIPLFGKGGGEALARSLGVPLLGEIPVDPEISAASDAGIPLQGEGKKVFLTLAKKVLEQIDEKQTLTPFESMRQVSPYEFSILWRDGVEKTYRLSDLQKRCPCAQCAENEPIVDPAVKAHKIESVGRYAIRIFFTSGCSQGLYHFSSL